MILNEKRKKILSVDDSDIVSGIEEGILGPECYIFLRAKDLESARRIVAEEKPDLILLDLYLPDGSGADFCRELRRNEPTRDISVIMITVSQKGEDKEACFRAGCNDFIIKPIDTNELQYKVEKLIAIAPRITYRILVKVMPEGGKDSAYVFGTSVNLSETGMMIESKTKFVTGKDVNLSFFLTTSRENINIKGRVVRSHREGFGGARGYGIIFREMSASDKKKIIELIQKQTYGQSKENRMFFAGDGK